MTTNRLKLARTVLNESKIVLSRLNGINEAVKSPDTYYNTHSEAVQAGLAYANAKGYDVDDDEWFSKVSTVKKPSNGKTVSFNLALVNKSNGEPVKNHMLVMQVYRDDAKLKKSFELNCYIS